MVRVAVGLEAKRSGAGRPFERQLGQVGNRVPDGSERDRLGSLPGSGGVGYSLEGAVTLGSDRDFRQRELHVDDLQAVLVETPIPRRVGSRHREASLDEAVVQIDGPCGGRDDLRRADLLLELLKSGCERLSPGGRVLQFGLFRQACPAVPEPYTDACCLVHACPCSAWSIAVG